MIGAMFDSGSALAAHARQSAGQRYSLLSDGDKQESRPPRRYVSTASMVAVLDVLRTARASMTVSDIAAAAGMSVKHARAAIDALLEQGEIEVTGTRRVGSKGTAARCYAIVMDER